VIAVDGFDGIGFVLTATDPFVGIDLDHCRDPHTGTVEPWAQKIISILDSYTEVTPSETGLHVFVKANLPEFLGPDVKGRRKGPVEIYASERYLTVTGVCPTSSPLEIKEGSEAVATVCAAIFPPEPPPRDSSLVTNRVEMSDEEIIGFAATAANSEKFMRLWLAEDVIDHSAADMALCSMLAFWTGDAAQIDRLFRISKLMRDKWNRRDYRERTIKRALELTTEVFGG